jgi:prepilin-type N-terminal cleavage/methylation domain-containing protein
LHFNYTKAIIKYSNVESHEGGVMTKNRHTNQYGFTLVELSIVLVIIGFIIAGIASATNMVKQSQLRSIITDFQLYETAYNNFKAKYNSIPGDMSNANSLFPAECTPETCNGDGDGIISFQEGSPEFNESYKFWRVLSLSKFINGNFLDNETSTQAILGVNVPMSKISGAGYHPERISETIQFNPLSYRENMNFLVIGKESSDAGLSLPPSNSVLTPFEAYSIDAKMDDGAIDPDPGGLGLPAVYIGQYTGKLLAAPGYEAPVGVDTCIVAVGRNSYNVQSNDTLCVLGLILP